MALNCTIDTIRFNWTVRGNIRVTGFLRINGILIEGQRFIDEVNPHTTTFEEFKSWVMTQNGQFSVIVEKPGEVWLSCGHTWSYPLFYRSYDGNVAVSDTPEKMIPLMATPAMDAGAIPYFLNFGVTPAGKTLVKGIFQVRPGETVRLYGSATEHTFSRPGEPIRQGAGIPGDPTQQLQGTSGDPIHQLTGTPGEFTGQSRGNPAQLAEMLRSGFSGYAGFLRDKEVLLPLTKGYDSRLLACLLKENGISTVTCATWGRPSTPEYPPALRVAEKLGFAHHFIPYTKELVDRFTADKTFRRYVSYAGHLSSMPFMQDYFAVRQLLEQGIIHPGTVVLPGHPGDFIRGAHLYPSLPTDDDKRIAGTINASFGTSYPAGPKESSTLQKTISLRFAEEEKHSSSRQKFDHWDYEERQCKLIGNSSLVYDFFGITHLEPLFDRKIMDRFLQLPFDQRLGSSLYNETVVSRFFQPHGVDMELKPPVNKLPQRSPLKEILTILAPRFLKKLHYPLDDDVFYREITAALMRSGTGHRYRHPRKPHFYNCYLSQWYLEQVRNDLKNSTTTRGN